MIILTEQQVLSVHEMMIKATGGSNGVRDMSLLQSAMNAPFFGTKGDIYRNTAKKYVAMNP